MDSGQAARMAAELRGQTVGGWLVGPPLGTGKSALVLEATRGGVSAALKVFFPDLVERYGKAVQLSRIGREVGLGDHGQPHLVRVVEGGECVATGYLFVVMERIEGRSLAAVLTLLPRERIRPLLQAVAGAARFLESRGLCHRDIKPDNIMVRSDFSSATLMDLGVLRPVGDGRLTDEDQRTFIGTLQYSSPEFLYRAEEDTVEGWRAITFYQLGAVLFDMIERRRIFAEYEEPFARLVDAVKTVVPRITMRDVPPTLILLANSALVKKPSVRLDVVHWEHFFEDDAGDPLTTAEARDRITRRIKQAQGPADGDAATVRVGDADEHARQTAEITSQVQRSVRAECVSSGILPPLEIRDQLAAVPHHVVFDVVFRSSVRFCLSGMLRLRLALKILDQASRILTVDADAVVVADELGDAVPAYVASTLTLFSGSFDDQLFSQRVQEYISIMMDEAQRVPATSIAADSVCPLRIALGSRAL